MPTQRKGLTESTITKRIKEGRGQGTGRDYIPWVKVNDFGSRGRSHRIYCNKTRRVHHFLSDLEKSVFLTLYWSSHVIDIREQFPLKREDTLEIATKCGIKHPCINGVNVVMSSDFLIDTNIKNKPLFAIQVKSSEELKVPRTIEKLEIERRYWSEKQIPWTVVTEKEINQVVKNNLEWLAPEISDHPIKDDELTMLQLLASQFKQYPNIKLVEVCKKIDNAYHLEMGQSLRDVRKLMANGYIEFNINKDFRKLETDDLSIPHVREVKKSRHVAHK